MAVPFTSLAGANEYPEKARMIRACRGTDKPRTARLGCEGMGGAAGLQVPEEVGQLGAGYPRRIESKNSALLLVALILSRRNSIASRSSIGYSSLRRIHTF